MRSSWPRLAEVRAGSLRFAEVRSSWTRLAEVREVSLRFSKVLQEKILHVS